MMMSSHSSTQLSYLIPAPTDVTARLLREAPVSDQPLTRLERCGPEVLSSAELLQLVLDSKTDPLLPLRILNQWATLNELAHASPAELLRIEGMTRIRLAHLRAALELGRRMWTEPFQDHPQIKSPCDAAKLLLPEMSGLEQEQFRVLLLNTKNHVIGTSMIYQGSLHTTVIRLAEVFRDAVRQNASSILVAHNHPSGSLDESLEDRAATREIAQAGRLLDVTLVDHLIIGRGNCWVSLKERGVDF